MLLIPAIDLKSGKCVRLKQGNMSTSEIFSDDPMSVADHWVREGAKRLHIVDLDGAMIGKPIHEDMIHTISKKHRELVIQVGGGIRNKNTVKRYLQAGVRYVVIGTQAIKNHQLISQLCREFPNNIIIGLDTKHGKTATDGWSQLSNYSAIEIAKKLQYDEIQAIVYTDISRDGMMNGINIESTVMLAESIDIPIIASGGIQNINHIKKLAKKSASGIIGAITGRAIYEGTLNFSAGQQVASNVN